MGTQYYKHPKYGIVYGDPTVTPTGRAAWPALVKPKEPPPPADGQQAGAPRYEVTIILPKSDEYVQKWIKAIAGMTDGMLKLFNQGRKAKIAVESVLKDGDEFDLEKYPYYKNSFVLIARNAKLPQLVDGKKQLIAADSITGGMFVRATVTPILTGWGLSYKLEALQLVKDDGTRFAGAARAASYTDMLPEVDSGEVEVQAEEGPAEEEPTGKAKALALL